MMRDVINIREWRIRYSPKVPASGIAVASMSPDAGCHNVFKFLGTVGIAQVEANRPVEVLDPHFQLEGIAIGIDAGVLLLVRREPSLERSCYTTVPFASPLGVVIWIRSAESVASGVASRARAAEAGEEGDGRYDLHGEWSIDEVDLDGGRIESVIDCVFGTNNITSRRQKKMGCTV